MTGIRTRSGLKTLVDANLPTGTAGITAVNHREVEKSIADSAVLLGEAEIIVINMTTTTPPGAPADRDAYVVGAGATGAWAGQDQNIAIWDSSVSPSAWVFVAPVDGAAVWNLADDTQYRWDAGISPQEWVAQAGAAGSTTESLIIAVGDETTVLTTGTAKVTFRMPYAFTLTAVRASLTTASTAGTVTADINESGTSILSTKLTIDAGEKTSTTAAAAAVISDTSLADDAEITIDVDDAGGDDAVSPTVFADATGLKITLIGTQT